MHFSFGSTEKSVRPHSAFSALRDPQQHCFTPIQVLHPLRRVLHRPVPPRKPSSASRASIRGCLKHLMNVGSSSLGHPQTNVSYKCTKTKTGGPASRPTCGLRVLPRTTQEGMRRVRPSAPVTHSGKSPSPASDGREAGGRSAAGGGGSGVGALRSDVSVRSWTSSVRTSAAR